MPAEIDVRTIYSSHINTRLEPMVDRDVRRPPHVRMDSKWCGVSRQIEYRRNDRRANVIIRSAPDFVWCHLASARRCCG
jgi:hypothetical protein